MEEGPARVEASGRRSTQSDGLSKRGTLNHIRFTVTDIERSRRFYAPLMRFRGYEFLEQSPERIAWASLTASGNLHWFILSVVGPGRINAAHDRYAPGLHHIAWNAESRSEVDQFYQILLEAEITVLDRPCEYAYEPGYYAVFFSDPDGIKLEYVHVPRSGSELYLQRFRHAGS